MQARRSISQATKTALLSLLVFVIGLSATVLEYDGRVQEHREDQARIEEEAAALLHYELQRRLDYYENANRDLAALFSASESITEHEFRDFLAASRFLKRLQAISFAGYLPKVAQADRQRFEQAARREHPGFTIRPADTKEQYMFPLRFAEYEDREEADDSLLGLDYASIPSRYQAMKQAAENGDPTAVLLRAFSGGQKSNVVLIFTPIREPEVPLALPGQRLAQVEGFTVSVLRLEALLASLYKELGAGQFHLMVYEGKPSSGSLVYDSTAGANSVRRHAPGAYTAELRFANHQLTSRFLPARETPVDRFDKVVLILGIALSLMAAYGVVAVQRLLASRRDAKELMDRFESLFENHPFAVCSLDPQWRLVHANQRMAQEIGLPQQDLAGRWAGDFVPEAMREMAFDHFQTALHGEAVAYTIVMVDGQGQRSDMSVVLIPMSARGKTTHVLAFAENITERKRAETELHASRQMLRLILDTVPQRIFWKDLNGAYGGGNRQLLEEAGLDSVDELVGKTDLDMPWRDMADRFQKEDAEVVATGVPLIRAQRMQRRRDGTMFWVESSKLPLRNDEGHVVGVLGVVEDITERKATEQELFRRANFDSLTLLPNRAHFYTQLVQALKRACRRGAPLALMYFDIDRFKLINDTHGHDVGDEVIRAFARRMRSVLREEDFVARLGGDEFVLIAENLAGEQAAEAIAVKMVAAMTEPVRVGEVELVVSTSIGIAYFKEGMTSDQLVKAADNAMYEAKRAGRNCFRRAA